MKTILMTDEEVHILKDTLKSLIMEKTYTEDRLDWLTCIANIYRQCKEADGAAAPEDQGDGGVE